MIDTSKAQRVIHWKPTTLEQAIKETCEFFNSADIYVKELKTAKQKFEKVDKYYPQSS